MGPLVYPLVLETRDNSPITVLMGAFSSWKSSLDPT